jgi:hypothetical protein
MKSDPPPPPDYQALAREQGQLNAEQAREAMIMNRPDEYGPYGNRTWAQDPNNPLKWTVNTSLSPAEQQKLEYQQALQLGMLQAGGELGLPAIYDAMNTNFKAPRDAQLGWEKDYAPDQRLQTESGMYELPWAQEALDFSGVAGIPEANMDVRKRMEEALYSMADRYLAPRMEKDQKALDAKLSNQGIFVGSAAHSDAQTEFDDAKNKAYGDVMDKAIAGGGDEMQRQFGLDMSRHTTGTADELTKGSFANNARGQLASELLNDMNARNAALMGQSNMATAQQQGSNTGTQAWLSQKAAGATMPINILNALQTGSQVNTPQYQPYAANASWEPAPIYQAGKDAYSAAANASNASNAQTGQGMQLAGTVGSAALMFL